MSRLFILSALLLIVTGCQSEVAEPPATESTATDATPADSSVATNENETSKSSESDASSDSNDGSTAKDVIIIDVRSQEEWDGGHLANAVHIPHTEIAERIEEVTKDKSAKIITYCKVGGRAGMAKTTLEEAGFTNVENGGGLEDMQERFPE